MQRKILLIRFNSIGDIVLSSPLISDLAAKGYDVHYLVKSGFSELLKNNPKVTKVWEYDSNYWSLLKQLRKEKYDYVLDLHSNLRSFLFRSLLNSQVFRLKKERIADFLMTRFGILKTQKSHIVNRFMDVSPMIAESENLNTEFYFEKDKDYRWIKLPAEKFYCISVSTAFETKNIPTGLLKEFIESYNMSCVLLGAKKDRDKANAIMSASTRFTIYDQVGKLGLDESAYFISQSQFVISGDSGLMHISAALGIPVVAVFGSTHPVLGYTPYYGDKKIKFSIVQNENLSCRPCTRQGRNSCPRGHFRCMNDISVDEILTKVEALGLS